MEFFWRKGRAYFQYRRGSRRRRQARYGGPLTVAVRRHPKRVEEFLKRAGRRPVNLPEEWYEREAV